MLESFQRNLASLTGETENKKFLLAVSGGVDSVVMAAMFRDSGLHYGIAHCNFQLRGKASEGDLKFVKKLAEMNDAPFFSISFDTMEYVKKNKVSVQMAARELRYLWFEEIRREENYDYIVTAHQADDTIETFFINLFRSAGLSGLRGIKAVNGNIIRPMLIFSKKDITSFAKRKKITWREDKSNTMDDYERNRIRHHLIPELEKIDEGATKRIIRTMELLASTEDVYREGIKKETDKYLKWVGTRHVVSLQLVEKLNHAPMYLFEIIKDFGFNYKQAEMICECVKRKEHSGRTFLSHDHRISIDRNYLHIHPHKWTGERFFNVTHDILMINMGAHYCWFESLKRDKKFKIDSSPLVACIDFDKLSFPLEVRKWKKGDRFYPLGMNQSKKISDFLIDNKISIPDKEDVYVMGSNRKIAWVIGHRIDDRFKITEATKKIYLCQLVKAKKYE